MNTIHRVPKTFNRIRFCRKLTRYSQEDLSYLLGVPARTLHRWEKGVRTPTLSYAIGLSVAFHRLIGEIFSPYREEWVSTINRRAAMLRTKKDRKSANDNEKR